MVCGYGFLEEEGGIVVFILFVHGDGVGKRSWRCGCGSGSGILGDMEVGEGAE